MGITIFGFGQPKALFLDKYPIATVVIGTRRLYGNYAGPAIRIRRGSDNAETDIGYLNDNYIDAAAIDAFLGADPGYVVTFYGQNGNNASQLTASAQMQIYTNKVNGQVYFGNDGPAPANSYYLLDVPFIAINTFYCFAPGVSLDTSGSAGSQCFYYGSGGSAPYLWTLRKSTTSNTWHQSVMDGLTYYRANVVPGGVPAMCVVSEIYDNNVAGNMMRIYEGTTKIGDSNVVLAKTIDRLFGYSTGSGPKQFHFPELLMFSDVDIQPAAVTALQENQTSFYGY